MTLVLPLLHHLSEQNFFSLAGAWNGFELPPPPAIETCISGFRFFLSDSSTFPRYASPTVNLGSPTMFTAPCNLLCTLQRPQLASSSLEEQTKFSQICLWGCKCGRASFFEPTEVKSRLRRTKDGIVEGHQPIFCRTTCRRDIVSSFISISHRGRTPFLIHRNGTESRLFIFMCHYSTASRLVKWVSLIYPSNETNNVMFQFFVHAITSSHSKIRFNLNWDHRKIAVGLCRQILNSYDHTVTVALDIMSRQIMVFYNFLNYCGSQMLLSWK